AGTYTHRSMTRRTRIEYATTHTMSEVQPRLSSTAWSLMAGSLPGGAIPGNEGQSPSCVRRRDGNGGAATAPGSARRGRWVVGGVGRNATGAVGGRQER